MSGEWTTMMLAEKTNLVRMWSKEIEHGSESTAQRAATAFGKAGFIRNQHVGANPKDMTPQTTLEWYAGQLMQITETGAWFAINSWINCTDKFAPPTHERPTT